MDDPAAPLTISHQLWTLDPPRDMLIVAVCQAPSSPLNPAQKAVEK